MLKLVLRSEEGFDEEKMEFVPGKEICTLILEHSLLSISKWEAIYCKPFLSTDLDFDLTKEYIKCMTINSNVRDEVYEYITAKDVETVADYISSSKTATWFSDSKIPGQPHNKGKMMGEVITSEIVYYWMISMNIPVEFQKWHLNRLLTLIRVISVKNDTSGGKKMTLAERRALNKARQAKYHTRG